MSFEDLVIPRDVIRDWSMVVPGGAVNVNLDTLLEGAVGLDIYVANLGAAPLTINWDGGKWLYITDPKLRMTEASSNYMAAKTAVFEMLGR